MPKWNRGHTGNRPHTTIKHFISDAELRKTSKGQGHFSLKWCWLFIFFYLCVSITRWILISSSADLVMQWLLDTGWVERKTTQLSILLLLIVVALNFSAILTFSWFVLQNYTLKLLSVRSALSFLQSEVHMIVHTPGISQRGTYL
jgi:hypothetical protein